MKSMLLSLSAVTLMMFAAQPSHACTLTPKGDSQLRLSALHETLDQMEILASYKKLDEQFYQLEVHNYGTGVKEVRTFRLEDTSQMCPVYKAIRVD